MPEYTSFFLRGFSNTIFYVAAATIIGLIITILGAYVLSSKDLLWGNVIMFAISFTMLFSGGIVPQYIVVKNLHLLDTPWAVILPACVSTMNLIILRTAFQTVPTELVESAKLDGAGNLTIAFKIMLPLVKASLATIALYYIISHWNSWFQASIYLKDRALYPLQLVLREILIINDSSKAVSAAELSGNMDNYQQLVKYCTIIVSSAPMIILYPFIMKYFKKGVMIGSLKG